MISKAGFLKAKLNFFSLFLEHALHPPFVKSVPWEMPPRQAHASKASEIFLHRQNQPRLMTPHVRICYLTALILSFGLHFRLGSLKRWWPSNSHFEEALKITPGSLHLQNSSLLMVSPLVESAVTLVAGFYLQIASLRRLCLLHISHYIQAVP